MFNTIEEAINDLQAGKLIIVCDDNGRENEGDLVGLAEHANAEMINFMINYGKGLVCCPITQELAQKLELTPMVNNNQERHQTAFTISLDHHTSQTGISAFERATTIAHLANTQATVNDFKTPGHVFPLIAKQGGVLVRPGHTEAAVDLARLANAAPVGVICEIINGDGTMARQPDLMQFAQQHNLKIIHIQDLINYRKTHELLIEEVAKSKMPTKFGTFDLHGYRSLLDNQEAVALIKGPLNANPHPLLRIHSECLTGDGFGSLRCDCGEQLAASLEQIEHHGGILIYLRQEGRGIGLLNKIKAYALQDQGMDTVEANLHLGFPDDMRDYFIAAQILRHLGLASVTLLSNNPRKFDGLAAYGINIHSRQQLIMPSNSVNHGYLATKVSKLGHLL